jgi:dimethylaniline monooxygenase (N-oxide forming)
LGKRVCVVGGGISGIAHAQILKKNGFDVVVFEKAPEIGGVWAVTYPGVRLQNNDYHYHLSDFPWPFPADFHPTGEQIRRYWQEAVRALGLDVRTAHAVSSCEEKDGGWLVTTEHLGERAEHAFDHLVVAIGQYTEGKHRPTFDGEASFRGRIGTERDVRDLDELAGQRVAVVGFGKSALDMATMAAARGATVHHVFRTPRWALPMHLLGVHSSWVLFNRFGSVMMTCWAHPTAMERLLHGPLAFGVRAFWRSVGALIRWQNRRAAAGDAAAAARIEKLLPPHDLLPDLRSAAALLPDDFLPFVAKGAIQPHHAELRGFEQEGLRLSDGSLVATDRVILCVGSESPRFPFLPDRYRALLEGEHDGPQLYRHLVHPKIPTIGFAGFNHGFMPVPSTELGAQWLACWWNGELELPSVEEMERTVEHVRAWKRANIAFEPSRAVAINTRYQQYLDILCADLGVSPYRKLPNVVAEVFQRYGASDYAGVTDEVRRGRKRPLRPVALHT